MLKVLLPRLGITTTFVDPENPKNFTHAIQENTRLFFAESLGNPKLDVLDLKGISREAKAAKVPFMVDSTLATPALQNPIAYGVNIVIHSLTKYANGNGSTMGGVIVDAGNFDWSSGKFPEFTTPSDGYHGLVLHDVLGPAATLLRFELKVLEIWEQQLAHSMRFKLFKDLKPWKSA